MSFTFQILKRWSAQGRLFFLWQSSGMEEWIGKTLLPLTQPMRSSFAQPVGWKELEQFDLFQPQERVDW